MSFFSNAANAWAPPPRSTTRCGPAAAGSRRFPPGSLGAGWLRELRGPFPGARFVATGGIDAGNARAYLDAGAVAVGVGTALTHPGGLATLLEVLRH